MKVYKYLAKKNIGTIIESIVYADSTAEATEKIKEMGYTPEKVEPLAIADKRIYERLNVEVTILFSVFKPGRFRVKPEFTGLTKNISAGGLLFSTTHELTQGAIINLVLNLPQNKGSFECLARVVRASGKINDLYEVAVCFLDLPHDDCQIINKYVFNAKR